jgi:N-acetylglucosamine-6-phosphate deacetylase
MQLRQSNLMNIEFPGFIDLQVNGFAGVDFNTPGQTLKRLDKAASAMRATGVTAFLPTLITASLERYTACATALRDWTDPAVVGFHLEGPYISPEDGARGAHPRAHVLPASIDDFQRRQEAAGGRILLVTLAPEVPGALPLIDYLVAKKVRVAIGHTLASSAQIADAIKAGATLSTHLGNGCPQTIDRHRNMLWDQLASDELSASFIADGHHLPPAVLKAMVRAKGIAQCLLVTDAMSAAAAPPARYWIGELEVEMDEDGRVSDPGTPYLAGSALTMDAAVANTVRYTGLPIEKVLAMATSQPARCLGLKPRGRVRADWDAESGRLKVTQVT